MLNCLPDRPLRIVWIAKKNYSDLCGESQRYEKITNKSSFGIIDIAESSTSDRIIVIVDTVRFIHDGAYRWTSGRQTNVSASH